ncbi:UDP-glucuronosyltransferase 2C1-like [Belonocnema kinseyi]|uniref:UDP-glucuronosyltransferase 2C1-like n=1 Tax=Belonocnema kinseyi TaxID=2817044 RepID=UPI00143DAD7B|nr:UDP-glucuronosyltransferase 2C1-like [Belonocnema kinseyi]
MTKFNTLFIILLAIFGSDGYRILAVFPFNSRSHNIFLEGVSRGLANRGHQVDVISHFEMKNPPKTLKTIVNLHGTRANLMNNFTIEFASQLGSDLVPFIAKLYGNELCELMGLEKFQKFLRNLLHYDAVVTEAFGANCFMGLGHILKNAPVIAVATTLEYSWISDAVRNPDSTAFAPNVLLDSDISTFWDRLKNTIVTELSKFRFYIYTKEAQTKAMRKYLRPNMPNIREVERSVALTLVNSFHSIFGIRIRSPGFIDIAGIHIEDNDDKLSLDLQKWMDESKDGVVYFTLGSMVIIETLSKETLLAIYASFSKIAPIRVLLKVVDAKKLPPNLPKNVRTSKWIPQIPVLRHNNTRLFIMHGGLMGIEEAIYYGVPLIGMPIYGDQFSNVRIVVKKNMAVRMDYRKITEQTLDKALKTVLTNPLFRESAKYESRLFRDRPMTATETTNFWVEYVIRNGPEVFKSPAIDMYWWQIALLDVYIFILLCFVLIIYLTIFIVKYAFSLFFRTLGDRQLKNKKKQ